MTEAPPSVPPVRPREPKPQHPCGGRVITAGTDGEPSTATASRLLRMGDALILRAALTAGSARVDAGQRRNSTDLVFTVTDTMRVGTASCHFFIDCRIKRLPQRTRERTTQEGSGHAAAGAAGSELMRSRNRRMEARLHSVSAARAGTCNLGCRGEPASADRRTPGERHGLGSTDPGVNLGRQ